ncbi:MAG: peptide deformylase [Bacteroidales bacterium]|nr:peptide deformylase [Bacteroidales bacterium]
MILPIVGYGHSVLRIATKDIDTKNLNQEELQELKTLTDNMFETMYKANGVGLAAPQINKSISLMVIDADPLKEEYPEGEGFKIAIINPHVIETSGENWSFEEGCLSLPGIHENVSRPEKVKIQYQIIEEKDGKLQIVDCEEELSGIRARVFQHEYDHLQGKVFVDRISNLRKAFLKKKLSDISNNKVRPDYKMLK